MTGKTIFLEDVYVKPEFRKKGIGAEMITLLKSLAKKHGCRNLAWSVLDWNQPALNFYHHIGAGPVEMPDIKLAPEYYRLCT